MGGVIQLVVRKESGDIVSLPVWTNSMTKMILKNIHFFAGDMKPLDEHVEYHEKLIDDYNANKETRQWNDRNASYYGKYDFGHVQPLEYGIVVIDFKNKVIVDMQSYTNANVIMVPIVRNTMTNHINVMSMSRSDADLQEFDSLLRNKAGLRLVNEYNSIDLDITNSHSLVDLNTFVNTELSSVVFQYPFTAGINESIMLDLYFDRNGFTVETFDISFTDDITECLARVESLGFHISATDKEVWNTLASKAIDED